MGRAVRGLKVCRLLCGLLGVLRLLCGSRVRRSGSLSSVAGVLLSGVAGSFLGLSKLALLAGLLALVHSGGDDAGEQLGGADSVVVARNREVDLIRITVGVQDGNNRDVELLELP